jgi:hypothetical protein
MRKVVTRMIQIALLATSVSLAAGCVWYPYDNDHHDHHHGERGYVYERGPGWDYNRDYYRYRGWDHHGHHDGNWYYHHDKD